jgi:hypothetical protein
MNRGDSFFFNQVKPSHSYWEIPYNSVNLMRKSFDKRCWIRLKGKEQPLMVFQIPIKYPVALPLTGRMACRFV